MGEDDMKQMNCFRDDMLDLDLPESSEDKLWRAGNPRAVQSENGTVILEIPFQVQGDDPFIPDQERKPRMIPVMVRAYEDQVIRITTAFGGEMPQDEGNPMLEWDSTLTQENLSVKRTDEGWEIIDTGGRLRMKVDTGKKPMKYWSSQIEPAVESFQASVYPDGQISVPFMSWDTFRPRWVESLPLGYIERAGKVHRCFYSLYSRPNEKFAGTGERFARMNLAGKTFTLENTDAFGVNSRRAYKNMPFYVSSRPYGLLILTPAHVRLSLADVSSRAAQAVIEDDILDLFFIGGGSLERILYNYRRITGFPRKVPLWSYGIWMSRMSYFSAEETREVASKLREGDFPCDVIHLDTGWFRTDWKCEWEFSAERFPNPPEYIREMKEKGFRISLWQLPSVAKGTKHYDTARKNRFIAPKKGMNASESNFSDVEYGGNIDFTNPEAVKWYQELLASLLRMGIAAIKTDFGEQIDMDTDYMGLKPELLHNLYCLLYQKAAFDITQEITGEGMIWARAGWIGCQRYPVHWGGDSASTWDGLAGSIRGGLHFGLSGYAFWSHDVPGFHGLPEFMNNWPDEELYVRWTQVGVFTSHIRYHGASPREPYEYPGVADLVRKWWKLRYCLIPYLADEGKKAVESGYPLLRALILHHEEDPLCWSIDDEFYCGESLLVAPILNDEGIRDVYLPKGKWTDLWTGELLKGPILLRDVHSPLSQIPVYAKTNSRIRVYPKPIRHTGQMDMREVVELVFDSTYKGLSSSVLGEVTGL
jgi:alpha-D-xyloside xylohydrolase